MGMYDTILAKVNDNLLNIQTKKMGCFLDNVYWLDEVSDSEFDKGVICLIDDWCLNDNFNSNQKFNLIAVFVQGIFVDYSIVKSDDEVQSVKDKLLNLWSNKELQNIVLSNALKIDKIKVKSTRLAYNEVVRRFADYSYVKNNLPEIMKYFDGVKNSSVNKTNLGFYFKILSNTLIDDKELKIKNFLKETTDYFSEKSKILLSKKEDILKFQETFPMAVSTDFLYAQYENLQASEYSEENVLQIYKQMSKLLDDVKAWASKAAIEEPNLINNFLCSHLFRETASPILNKKFMALDIITHNYIKLYNSYPQLLIDSGGSFQALSQVCNKNQLDEIIVENSLIFLSNPSWQPHIINANILSHKKYFNIVMGALVRDLNFKDYNKEIKINYTLLKALIKMSQEPDISDFEFNGMNIKGLILNALLTSKVEKHDLENNSHLTLAIEELEKHILSSGIFSKNEKKQKLLLENLKNSPLLSSLYSSYEKNIFTKNLEIIDAVKKVKNSARKI